MRKCGSCGLEKELTRDNFFYKNKSQGIFSYTCIKCTQSYRKQHYLDNKDKYIDSAKKGKEKYKQEIEQFLYEYLNAHPCSVCGETDPVVLEFDHLNNKTDCISTLVYKGYSKAKIQEEIEKCQVLCCNCHRRKTAKDFGYQRYKISLL